MVKTFFKAILKYLISFQKSGRLKLPSPPASAVPVILIDISRVSFFTILNLPVYLDIRVKYFVILYGKHYENLTKMSSQGCCSLKEMSKPRFFTSRRHMDRDSGFSSKIAIIPRNRDGWTVCTEFFS